MAESDVINLDNVIKVLKAHKKEVPESLVWGQQDNIVYLSSNFMLIKIPRTKITGPQMTKLIGIFNNVVKEGEMLRGFIDTDLKEIVSDSRFNQIKKLISAKLSENLRSYLQDTELEIKSNIGNIGIYKVKEEYMYVKASQLACIDFESEEWELHKYGCNWYFKFGDEICILSGCRPGRESLKFLKDIKN